MQNQHQTPLNNQNLKTSPPQLIKAGGTKNVSEDLSGVRWYVNSTSEERVNLVNGELASWGWDINHSEFFDDVVYFDYEDLTVSAYYYPDNTYRWFCAFIDGVEICSIDFRGVNPGNVSAYCDEFKRSLKNVLNIDSEA